MKLKENISSNKGFALMLQKDDGSYEENGNSTWPTNMIFNNELSGCIDVNGNTIEDALNEMLYAEDVNTKTYLSWEDIDIAYYCLTTNENSDDCTWGSVTGMSIETDYTLTSGDKEKTVYAYLKDFAGNISDYVDARSALYFTVAPIIVTAG